MKSSEMKIKYLRVCVYHFYIFMNLHLNYSSQLLDQLSALRAHELASMGFWNLKITKNITQVTDYLLLLK